MATNPGCNVAPQAGLTSRLASSGTAGVLGLTAGHFLIDLCMGWLPPLLPFLAERLGFTMALAGTAVAVVSTVSSFSQPAFGWLGDRVRGNGLLAACVVWTTAFTALFGLVRGFWLLVGAALLAAMGSALYHPLGSVRMVRLYPKHKGKAMSLYSASGSLGFALAPVVAVPLVISLGLEGSLLLLIPGVLVAGLKLAVGRRSPVAEVQEAAQLSGGVPRYGALAWLQVIMALRSWVLMAVATFLVWYLVDAGVDATRAAMLLSAYLLAGVAGGLAGGALTDRRGHLGVLTGSGLASLVFLWGFLTTGGWLRILNLALAGAALHAAFPGSVVLAQELLPAHAGIAAGMMMGLSFGVGGLGVAVTGWLADAWGLARSLHVTILALVPATLLVAGLREAERRGAEVG